MNERKNVASQYHIIDITPNAVDNELNSVPLIERATPGHLNTVVNL